MFETTTLTISKNAYLKNLKFIRKQIGNDVQFCSVVKGNAYGHGIAPFAKMAVSCGVDYFSVYSTDEAYQIKQAISEPISIVIMGMIEGTSLKWAIQEGVEFFVFDKERLEKAVEIAEKLNTKCINQINEEVITGIATVMPRKKG